MSKKEFRYGIVTKEGKYIFVDEKNIKALSKRNPDCEACMKLPDGTRGLMKDFVWIYFNGDIPDGKEVRRKNGDIKDNRIENLYLAEKES